jgi:hypothetical protein
MKISTLINPAFISTRFGRIALGVGASTVAIALSSVVVPQSAWAQSTGQTQPLEEFTTPQSEQDSFSGRMGSGGWSVFDLIHNAQLGTRDVNEVIGEQRESLNQATEDFRQQQLLQLRNPGSPVNSVTTPQPQTPEQ